MTRSRSGVSLPAPDAPRVVTLEQNYRIAPLDTLAVRVFKMPDLSGDFEVDLTGNLQLPLIGSVPAAELTTAELDQSSEAQDPGIKAAHGAVP